MEDINLSEILREVVEEENQTRKIVEILNGFKDIDEANKKIKRATK